MVEVSKELLDNAINCIKNYIEEGGGCDHGVNICMCREIGLLLDLQIAAGYYKDCPDCNDGKDFCLTCYGEGYVKADKDGH